MLPSRSWILASFCLAVALVAAAVSDFLLERASDAGLFGSGNFTDHSNLDVIPMLAIGGVFAVIWTIQRIKRLLGGGASTDRDWLRASASALDARTILKLAPAIFTAQLSIVFLMETIEQIVVAGHPLGGTIWLGAPVLVSLIVHACFGVALTALFSRVLHAFAETLAGLVRFIRSIASFAVGDSPRPVILRRIVCARHASPVLCRIGVRAPPYNSA